MQHFLHITITRENLSPRVQGFFDLLSKEFSFYSSVKKKYVRNDVKNRMRHSKMRKDGWFLRNREKTRSKLEKSIEILMEHSKMRKDASVLRNHDLKIKIVELDVGFHVVVSKVRTTVSFLRYPDFKITCVYEFGPIRIITDLGARSIVHKISL